MMNINLDEYKTGKAYASNHTEFPDGWPRNPPSSSWIAGYSAGFSARLISDINEILDRDFENNDDLA